MARNLRSQAVMRHIGMTTDPAEDFDDPDVDEGPLRQGMWCTGNDGTLKADGRRRHWPRRVRGAAPKICT